MARMYPVILFLLCNLYAFTQQVPSTVKITDKDPFKSIESSRNEFLDSLYVSATGTGNAYINGHDYFPYHFRSKHKPILFFGNERRASMTVNGRQYDNLVLQYDTFTDEVIFPEIENAYGQRVNQISINKNVIDSVVFFFRDDTIKFKYFDGEDTGEELPSGFYEVAYDGITRFLIRHRSVIHQRNGVDEYFYSPVRYVKTPIGYQRIRSSSRFAVLFGTGAPMMKRILTQNRVNLRKASKNQIINVLKSYDSQ
jgi:hypothetical protein